MPIGGPSPMPIDMERRDSLSQIAFAITGTKWSGPRFFGLRDRRPQINAGALE